MKVRVVERVDGRFNTEINMSRFGGGSKLLGTYDTKVEADESAKKINKRMRGIQSDR